MINKKSAASYLSISLTRERDEANLTTCKEIIQKRGIEVGVEAVGRIAVTAQFNKDSVLDTLVYGIVTYIHPEFRYVTIDNGNYRISFHPITVWPI